MGKNFCCLKKKKKTRNVFLKSLDEIELSHLKQEIPHMQQVHNTPAKTTQAIV